MARTRDDLARVSFQSTADWNEADRAVLAVLVLISDECWANSEYIVAVERGIEPSPIFPTVTHLTVRRRDRMLLSHSKWCDLQYIKDQVIGSQFTAIEIYPPSAQVIDLENAYHLWAFDDPEFQLPFGLHNNVDPRAKAAYA
jgi:hypothetical protein